jgi:hypothetical protein
MRKANRKPMLTKSEIEKITTTDLTDILNTQIVYKYSSFDIGLDKIILEKTLLFSHPSVFNDPFDCNEYLLKVRYEEDLILETINQLIPDSEPRFREEILRRFRNPENIAKTIRDQKNKYRISCFSKLHDEILMWSHYADKHSGICIGFNFPHVYENKFILCGIKYISEIKPLDGRADIQRVLLYWLTSKSSRWEYEQEIRAITTGDPEKKYDIASFDKKYIKEIIFGCNVEEKVISKALDKIEKSDIDFNQIEIKKMEIDKDTFRLKEKLIKPSA